MKHVALILALLGALGALAGAVGKARQTQWWMPVLVAGLAAFALGLIAKLLAG